jgi:hypothetical protein
VAPNRLNGKEAGMSLKRLATASLCGIFLLPTSVCADAPGCDSYDALSAYLETAHKLRETARAWQSMPSRFGPDAALRFFRNDETGVWAVVRIDPPDCARIIVAGYGWADSGAGDPL